MKSLIKNIVLYVVLACLVYLAEFQGNEYAGNGALFSLWVIIVFSTLLVLFGEPDDLFKNVDSSYRSVKSTCCYLLIGILATCGWYFTASAYLFCSLVVQSKYSVWLKKQQEEESSIKGVS